MPKRLVVIGGDAAGMSAASQARKRLGSEDLEIIVFERGNHTSYSACGIPYLVGGTVPDLEDLVVRRPEQFRSEQDIDVRMHTEVIGIDLERRAVSARGADGTEVRESFDDLLIATGGSPIRPPLPGVELGNIFGVQTLDDGAALKEFVAEHSPKRAVVVGAGYIGIEMAEAFKILGLEVSVVEMAPQPMSTLDPEMGELVAEAMEGMGIQVLVGEGVERFEGSDGRVSSVVTSERTLEADVVVLGLGARPNVDLAKEAGIPIGPSGAIQVDRRMRTPEEGVWAAGDCAEKFHLVSLRPVSIALGTHANKEGRTAGINIAGGYESFPGVLGTAVTKVCSLEVARTGLKEEEAREAGFEILTATVDSTTRAGYYPGAAEIKTKMIVERVSGRLLGGQIIGQEGAAKRIDVIATALWNQMTAEEMLSMDLSYAPPFAPVWDPVLITARKAWQAVEEDVAGK
jgi:NADPH-dependent 2,4-dienoyl-CoA reductase/sulfur reductase-like enzyme